MTNTIYKNIYSALAAAQQNMAPVIKGSVNPHYKSKYADLSDVMKIALPALNDVGICICGGVVLIEGKEYFRTTFAHGESDTAINCDVPLALAKQDMQGMKSATTYAKRIGIETLAGIAPEDDDGNEASKTVKAKQNDNPVSNEQAVEIDILLREVGADRAAFLQYFKTDDVQKIRVSDYETAIAMLNKKKVVKNG